jgi:hypothetical protein
MTPEFEEALGLWESGELSRDELARCFPDEDVAGLLDAFDGMSAASAGPTPDAAVAWAVVRTRLPARLADRRRGRGKAIRLLAAALIAVLVLGASAYAVVPSMRRALNDAASALTRDDDDRSEPVDPADSADEPTANVSDDVGSTADPDEGAAEDNDANADGDADELDADHDPSAGSNDAEDVDGSGSGTADGSLDDGSDQDGGSGDENSGFGEERASSGIDNGPDSGSEDPEN